MGLRAWWRERREGRALERDLAALSTRFASDYAKAGTSDEARRDVDETHAGEAFEIVAALDALAERQLLRRARRALIPIPKEAWDPEPWPPASHRLTTAGIEDLRRKLRDERRERMDRWLKWGALIGPALVGLTGLLGTLTGLLAVWQR